MMLGGVLASLGMVAGSFCRTLGQLYLTAGFITGDCHFESCWVGTGYETEKGQAW